MDRIDEWLETPVFVPDPDEKWEELATSHHGPVRLAAAIRLRIGASVPRAAGAAATQDGGARDAHAQEGMRSRLGRVLDRWAAAEVEAGERLERVLLPERWRAGHEGGA